MTRLSRHYYAFHHVPHATNPMAKRPLAKLSAEGLLEGLSSMSESEVRHLILSNNCIRGRNSTTDASSPPKEILRSPRAYHSFLRFSQRLRALQHQSITRQAPLSYDGWWKVTSIARYTRFAKILRDWEIFRGFFDRKGQDVLEAKLRDTYYLVLRVYDLCHYPNSLFRDTALYIKQL